MKRVALLVDARSLGYAVHRQTNRKMKVDYGALARLAQTGIQKTLAKRMAWQDERSLVIVKAFLGPSGNEKQDHFITELKEIGFIVQVCDNKFTQRPKSITDLMMLAEALALIHTNKIDVLVIATADSDFYVVVQAARQLGVQVELVSVEHQVIPEFAKMTDIFIDCQRAGLLIASQDTNGRNKIQQQLGPRTRSQAALP